MQAPNPWGYDNKDLLTMYQGASADGECPLVVDTRRRAAATAASAAGPAPWSTRTSRWRR